MIIEIREVRKETQLNVTSYCTTQLIVTTIYIGNNRILYKIELSKFSRTDLAAAVFPASYN